MENSKHIYHVYIMTNQRNTVLYVGFTGKGLFRIAEHKEKKYSSFSSKYNLDKLVYIERFTEVTEAINREKQLKKWGRAKKVQLIEKQNPEWLDIFEKLTENDAGA